MVIDTLSSRSSRFARCLLVLNGAALLSSCATVGSLMSPYSERFSCKNSDHGQCIHPDAAYGDAVADRTSRSDPKVTRNRERAKPDDMSAGTSRRSTRRGQTGTDAFTGYRDSVYRELQGLIEQPVTPMLRAPRTVRTLILPYADRQRRDRLYMPRYVYSIVDTPNWVVGDYLVQPIAPAAQAPVLGQVREAPDADRAADDAEPRR